MRAALSILAVILIVCLGVVGATALATGLGKHGLVKDFHINAPADIVTSNGGKTVTIDGIEYTQKAGMTTILLLGHDGRQTEHLNGQVDFLMVAAVDTESGQISLISIPRDTMVPVKRTYDKSDEYYDTQQLQIAAAFAYGSDFDHSARNVCDDVSGLLYGIPINYYYVLDVNGVGTLADAVDGVQLTSLQDVPKTDMKEGETLDLRGDRAKQYVMERDTQVEWSAFDRLERQRQFVEAYMNKLMEVARADPGTLFAAYDALASYSTTNIGPAEFSYLASVLLDHGVGDLKLYSLGGERTYNEETDYEEFHPDKGSVYDTVLEVYYEPAMP